MFMTVMNEFLATIITCNCPRMQDALKCIVLVSGEALLFSLATRLLERVVCFLFFCLKYLLTLCHTVS